MRSEFLSRSVHERDDDEYDHSPDKPPTAPPDLGRHANPRLALTFDESRQWVAYGINHLDLLNRPEVYAQIKQWLG